MEQYSNLFKYFCKIEYLLGTSTHSLEGLERNVSQVTYSAVLVAVTSCDLLYGVYNCFVAKDSFLKNLNLLTYYIIRGVSTVYFLSHGIFTVNKIAAVINLASVEKHMKNVIVESMSNTETAALYLATTMLTVHVTESALFFIKELIHFKLPNFYYVSCNTYFDSVQCSQLFGCLLFLAKLSRIQQTLTMEVDRLLDENRQPVVAVVCRREAWTDDTDIREQTLSSLQSIQTVLFATEKSIQSSYWLFVVMVAFMSAVSTPSVILSVLSMDAFHFWSISVNMLTYILWWSMIVFVQSKYRGNKKDTTEKMANLLMSSRGETEEGSSRASIRRQLCFLYHSNDPFDCFVFDVDFHMLMVVLETTLLVVTTVMSSI